MIRQNRAAVKHFEPYRIRFIFFDKISAKLLTKSAVFDTISFAGAAMAQLVEHILGKDEVPSSNLGSSSRIINPHI